MTMRAIRDALAAFLSRRQLQPKQGNADERQHNCNNTSRLDLG